jgi:polysaccharide deacetylase 2 family uncharacterized protein YibQ
MNRYFLGLLMFICAVGRAEVYQLVLDGEDTAYSVRSGNWTLDKTGSFLGNYRFSSAGPGTGASVCCWTIDAIPTGTYNVEFYVDNGDYASAAEYVVEHDTGITTVTKSQNFVGTGWKPLGTFAFTNAGRILQTDKWTGPGTKAIADALRLTLIGEPQAHTGNVVPPAITVVIDDLGALNPATSNFTSQLLAGAPNYTYAIIPSLTYSTAVLQDAQNKGIETILHQPLQYIGQPDTNPSDTTRVYIGMTDAQILSVVQTNLNNTAPYVIGVNNHQGSRFSEYAQGLQVMLAEIKTRGFFYYDSRTISDTLGYGLAKQNGMLAAHRDLFLDGTSSQDTKNKVMSVAYRAKYAPTYEHLLIGHQSNNTVPALVQLVSELQTTGVALRRLSRNVHYIVETDMQPPGASVQYTGVWSPSPADMISHDCADGNAMTLQSGTAGSARFIPNLPKAGSYRVFVGFAKAPAATTAQVKVHGTGTDINMTLDQTQSPNRWHYIGLQNFAVGTGGYVELSKAAAPLPGIELVRADAVKFVYDGPAVTDVGAWTQY